MGKRLVYFIDTNIFLRLFTDDSHAQHLASKRLFEKARNSKISLIASALVVFELIWTLSTFYRVPKNEIVGIIKAILKFPNLKIEHQQIFKQAVEIWGTKNIDFNDAFNYVWAQKKKVAGIYSYDKHFDLTTKLSRLEP